MDAFETAVQRLKRTLAGPRPRRLHVEGFRPAAVLVPLLRRGREPYLLFTRRTQTLAHHRGEVAFPGGAIEDGEGARQAALRETREEVGLAEGSIRVLGLLDDRPSVSGYIVTPVVAAVPDPPASFVRRREEVREIFEVPFARLLDPRRARAEWRDRSRLPAGAPANVLDALRIHGGDGDARRDSYRVHFYDTGLGSERVVWGLTGRILKDLLETAFPDGPPALGRDRTRSPRP